MPPKRAALSIRKNEDVHSQDSAVAESVHRAQFIMSRCNGDSEDTMAAFFAMSPLVVFEAIYRSMFAWRPWRRAVVDKLCEIKFMDLVADAAAYLVKNNQSTVQNVEVGKALIYGLICSATDCSPEAGRVMIAKDMIPILVKNITTTEDEMAEEDFLVVNMAAIHNIAKLPESKEKFEAVKATEVIKPYFAHTSEKIQISALCAVACMLGDSASSANLIDDHEIIPKLVQCLKAACNESEVTEEHNYLGFSAEELVESLAFLAVNDDNKLKIAKCDTLPLLVTMLQSNDAVEQGRAVDCLWALAFNESIRKDMLALENCCISLEKVATTSSDSALKLKASRAFDFVKVGRDGLLTTTEKKAQTADTNEKSSDGHIFISYSWKHQDMARSIRQLLLDKGFRVWMDIDNMHNNTLEAMAQGVEKADLVLILYSEYYKQSNMCRTEAEYVFKLGKLFIPINMQYRYFPTGWLGIILGARLYVDFSLQKHPLDEVIPRLFHEIAVLLKPGDDRNEPKIEPSSTKKTTMIPSVKNDVPPVSAGVRHYEQKKGEVCGCCQMMEKLVTELVTAGSNNSNLPAPSNNHIENTSVRGWKSDAVQSWLRGEGLGHISLPDFDGPALLGLYESKRSASQFYYSSLLKLVGDSFADCIRVTAALDNLFSQNSKL